MQDVVIAGYARSPFTVAKKGALARIRPDDLAAQVIRGLIERTPREPGGYRGHHHGLRLPGGRAGDERRAAGRAAGGSAAERLRG